MSNTVSRQPIKDLFDFPAVAGRKFENIWFGSDLHFSHAGMLEGGRLSERPFVSIDEMNEAILAAINERVGPDDLFIMPGDICMGTISESMAVAAQINGEAIALPGNHDRVFPGLEKRGRGLGLEEWSAVYEDEANICFLPDPWVTMTYDGVTFMISHFPYEGDSRNGEERFAEARPPCDGLPIVHGHVHEQNQTSTYVTPDGVHVPQVNVGMDAWGRPVHADEVVALLRADRGLVCPPSPSLVYG